MKRTSSTIILLAAFALGAAMTFGAAVQGHDGELHHTVVPADSVQWGPAPPSLPPGAEGAVLLGSPKEEGPFVLRLKFPAGFIVPPHVHSKEELVTVISGSVAFGTGEKADLDALEPLAPGSFVHLPAGMPHYLQTQEETVVQVNGMGPFDVTYIDPNDDPRKK